MSKNRQHREGGRSLNCLTVCVRVLPIAWKKGENNPFSYNSAAAWGFWDPKHQDSQSIASSTASLFAF